MSNSIFTSNGLSSVYHVVLDTIFNIVKDIMNQVKVLNTIQRVIIAIYFFLVVFFFSMAIYYALFQRWF